MGTYLFPVKPNITALSSLPPKGRVDVPITVSCKGTGVPPPAFQLLDANGALIGVENDPTKGSQNGKTEYTATWNLKVTTAYSKLTCKAINSEGFDEMDMTHTLLGKLHS